MKRALTLGLFLIPVGIASCALGCQQTSEEQLIHKVKSLQEKLMNEKDSAQRGSIMSQYIPLVEKNHDGIVMTNITGDILEANQAYQDMLEYTLAELRALSYQQITPQKWHEMEKGMVSDAMNRDYVCFQKEYMRKDGAVFPIEITGWIIKNASGKAIGTGSVIKQVTQ
ncbi:PAS domain S-box protein [Chloroflexota bacterium]